MADIRIQTLTGAAITPHLPSLARLRTEIFRDYPYLYEGSDAAEQDHLAAFARSAGAALVAAFDGDAVIGCATCLPAVDETEVSARVRDRGADPSRVCYFGESVLRHAYRGRGVGVAFFERREAHARTLPGCTVACFAAVRRAPNHPLRQADYVPLDTFWHHRGYTPWPGPPLVLRWKQVDGPEAVENQLDFWVRDLIA